MPLLRPRVATLGFTHFTMPLRMTRPPPTALDALIFTNFHNAVAAAAQSASIAVEVDAPVDFTSQHSQQAAAGWRKV
jgi:hypothetical protein